MLKKFNVIKCPMMNACHGLVLKGLNYDVYIVICWNCLKLLSATQSLICFNCLSFNRNTNNHNTRGHCFKLNVTLCHKNVFKSFLTNRIVNIWNNLHNR